MNKHIFYAALSCIYFSVSAAPHPFGPDSDDNTAEAQGPSASGQGTAGGSQGEEQGNEK